VAGKLIAAGLCARQTLDLRPGECVIVETKGVITPTRVMFLGTRALEGFDYEQMRVYARQAIEFLIRQAVPVQTLTTTVHGTGYGLDAVESLQSLVRGFDEGMSLKPSFGLREIKFVELHERTARMLTSALDSVRPSLDTGRLPESKTSVPAPDRQTLQPIPLPASDPPAKRHVFVALPFSEQFEDVYEYGIYAPVRACELICEKTNESAFTGDILLRIRDRIETAWLVIADLTEARPNVYLEVGYAWGKGKDGILLAREGEELHFDVARHRCIYYKSIRQLARDLEKLLHGLADTDEV
jgi:hypothetical protein